MGVTLVHDLAVVARELNQAVVGSCPDDAFFFGRFRDGKNQIVKFDAGLVFGDGPAGILLLGFIVAGQVRADGLPGMTAVGGAEQILRGVVELVGIVRRKDDGHGPGIAVFLDGGIVAVGIERPLLNVLHLVSALVVAGDVAEVGAGIDNVGIARIDGHVAAFSAAHGVPIGTPDGAVIAGSGDADGAVVLLRAVNVIRKIVVGDNVIELRGRLVKLSGPVSAAVDGNGGAAVVAVDDAIGIVGIDPQAVMIAVRQR